MEFEIAAPPTVRWAPTATVRVVRCLPEALSFDTIRKGMGPLTASGIDSRDCPINFKVRTAAQAASRARACSSCGGGARLGPAAHATSNLRSKLHATPSVSRPLVASLMPQLRMTRARLAFALPEVGLYVSTVGCGLYAGSPAPCAPSVLTPSYAQRSGSTSDGPSRCCTCSSGASRKYCRTPARVSIQCAQASATTPRRRDNQN
eukprot:scaffold98150_cov102-Phaeocystis_antarctica.AAC.5